MLPRAQPDSEPSPDFSWRRPKRHRTVVASVMIGPTQKTVETCAQEGRAIGQKSGMSQDELLIRTHHPISCGWATVQRHVRATQRPKAKHSPNDFLSENQPPLSG